MNEPIDSRQLHIFLVLARKGSLKAAAAELFLTNSAISHSVTNLEASLGVQLFHRSGKGLVLTDKGEFLLRKSRPIVAQMNNLRQDLAGENPDDRGSLRVVAGSNFVQHLMPSLVAEFNECFSKPQLTVRALERDQRIPLLREQNADVAIMEDPPEDGPEFTYTRLFDDELKLVLHASHPLARLEVIPLRSLAGMTLLVTRIQSYSVQSFLNQIRRRGFDVRECVESGGAAAIMEMVKLGQGMTLQSSWLLARLPPSPALVVRPMDNLRMTLSWAYVRPRWNQPTLADRTLLRLCQRLSRELSGPPSRLPDPLHAPIAS